MDRSSFLDFPILTFSRARSASFVLQNRFMHWTAMALAGRRANPSEVSAKTLQAIRKEIDELLKRDSANIAKGLYPISVLRPESPIRHWARYPKVLIDAARIGRRRKLGRTTEFSPKSKELTEELPRYYRRNFHFQTDGYLSDRSAELYDHQVEILFAGAADPMRRLILPPLRQAFGKSDGRGLTFLELGAGTGSATRFVRLTFPKAKIVALDLSDPYLKVARKRLGNASRIDFIQGNASALPFRDGTFDAVYSVFLFHELPLDERKAVLKESLRVLKDGGTLALVDSLQAGDRPALEEALRTFPQDFHEPFYRNYLAHPMESLLKALRLDKITVETGFFSKVVSARKSSRRS